MRKSMYSLEERKKKKKYDDILNYIWS